jgi:hypothetical protein
MIIPGEYVAVEVTPREDSRTEVLYRHNAPRGTFSLTVSFPIGSDIKIGHSMKIESFGTVSLGWARS